MRANCINYHWVKQSVYSKVDGSTCSLTGEECFEKCDDFQDKDLLTTGEKLFSEVTHERFVQLLNRNDCYNMNVSSNSYGEFMFVTIDIDNDPITFYGLGYHEVRQRPVINEWFFYKSYMTFDKIVITSLALEQVMRRKKELEAQYEKFVQSEIGIFTEEIARLTDDDFALSSYDELEGIFNDICDE